MRAHMMHGGTRLPDGRRVTGRNPYRQNGQSMLRLTFKDANGTVSEWSGRESADVPASAPYVPGVRHVTAGPTRGGRDIPNLQLLAAVNNRPRRKTVGTQAGYELLISRMSY